MSHGKDNITDFGEKFEKLKAENKELKAESAPSMIYVQKENSDTWHYAANCSNLPELENIAKSETHKVGSRPSSGEICNQCHSKETHGTLVPIEERRVVKGEGHDRAGDDDGLEGLLK